ncbi:contact-dependent growth inhibition system immunity protein [Streptomyces canus]|uniref:contact-dependent growth inhibition system immunity protein n=1 Tax=Streptomyces canus TaxID=58343 RepID=UPI00278250BA|nr:contact-dependent growth inhibition system immunity protein [Streptomyces canus]MDQ0767185.1 NAD(P)-dependent dehydrogenase (short-subunit alcohol dehydrogenase family) [Streptomyces canus]
MTRSRNRGRSLEELERDRWPAPPTDATRLVATAHALRRRPIDELTVEDLRLLIGQDIGLPYNHLGHFRLATGLRRALAAASGARVVVVSSSAQSKTANVLFAVEADKRWAADGIRVNALHPGGILTNLSRHMDPEVLERRTVDRTKPTKTPQQGAATSVLLATSPLLEGVGGRYFEDCNEAETAQDTQPYQAGSVSGVTSYALDPEAAARLWEVSLDAARR